MSDGTRSVAQHRQIGRGPPLGRHVAAVAVTLVLIPLVWWVPGDRGDLVGADSWNQVLADTSLILLCLIIVLGPVGRFVPRMRGLVPWGRELGIAMFVTAGLHVLILFDGNWDLESRVNKGDTTDLWSSPAHTIIGPYENSLNTNWWNGAESGLGVMNISSAGSSMTFTYGYDYLQVTPDVQLIINPARNPTADLSWLFGLRARGTF